MNKETKKEIKRLKKDKKYDEIFAKFGKEIYNKSVPNSYKSKELKKLKKERKI